MIAVLSSLLLCSCAYMPPCYGPDGGVILPVGYNNPYCYGTAGSYGGGYYPVYGGYGGYGSGFWGGLFGGGYGYGYGGYNNVNVTRNVSINNSGNTTNYYNRRYTGGTYTGGTRTYSSYRPAATSYGGGYRGNYGGGYAGAYRGGYGGGYRGR